MDIEAEHKRHEHEKRVNDVLQEALHNAIPELQKPAFDKKLLDAIARRLTEYSVDDALPARDARRHAQNPKDDLLLHKKIDELLKGGLGINTWWQDDVQQKKLAGVKERLWDALGKTLFPNQAQAVKTAEKGVRY